MKKIILFLLLLPGLAVQSQLPDHIYESSIHTVKLFKYGDIYSYPILKLNSADQLELHFDDMEANVRNCYYTYQLCNADWSVSSLQPFDYIRGFQSTRITITVILPLLSAGTLITRPLSLTAVLFPVRSGNYLLKVFLNNDTSSLLFTKRFLVVDSRVSIAAQILQPFNMQLSRSDQRVQVGVSTVNAQINTLSPQDLKVVVLQNNIWPAAATVNRPNIYRGNYYEYNDDAITFPAGREWRWVDLRSMRLMSDRVQKIIDTAKRTDIYVKPDAERRGQIYVFYRDLNGIYTIENTDGNNPYWQSDYGYVHFTYVPPGNQAYAGKDLYLFGELTNYSTDDASRMIYNSERGIYEGTLFLKQGYYNYTYVSVDAKENPLNRFSFASTEGNFNTTENNYMVLVYYRAFGARADELIGYAQLNTLSLR